MSNPKINQYPIRYFSIVTVPKTFSPDFSAFDGKALAAGAAPEAVMGELSKIKSQVSSLTPYLFILFEVEQQKAYWTYFDLAGNLGKVQFIPTGGSYVLAEKVVYPNGAYSYDVKAVLLERK